MTLPDRSAANSSRSFRKVRQVWCGGIFDGSDDVLRPILARINGRVDNRFAHLYRCSTRSATESSCMRSYRRRLELEIGFGAAGPKPAHF